MQVGIEVLLRGVEGRRVNCSNELTVSSIAYDSREVTAGSLFAALAGVHTDGRKYIAQAVESGAILVLAAEEDADLTTAQFICLDTRKALRQIAANFYAQPEKKINLIGITGTNGKTTIAQIIAYALRKLGRRRGVLGTVEYDLAGMTMPAPLTTPESPDFQKYLQEMLVSGAEFAVCEYSSQALAQDRVSGENTDYAVFTNLSRDHLDNHGSMENYFDAKKQLFDKLAPSAVAVINTADKYAEKIVADSAAMVIRVGYNSTDDFYITDTVFSALGTKIDFIFSGEKYTLHSALVGDFNVLNLLEAVAVLYKSGISLAQIINSVEHFSGVGGRLERLDCSDGRVAFVDYAHTDDALLKALQALKDITQGRLIIVFGCGGDRDRGKRPLMAEVAEEHADLVIITNDNPRTEDPEAIMADIMNGIEYDENVIVDFDRKNAIETALNIATDKDIVLVAGKGHEDYQILGREKIHFDDREVIRNVFDAIGER